MSRALSTPTPIPPPHPTQAALPCRATGRKGYEYDISTPRGGMMREPMGGCVYTSLKAAREAAAQSALYNLTH